MSTEAPKFEPVEVQIQVRGGRSVVKVVKTQAAMDKLVAKVSDDGNAIVAFRKLDG